MDIDSGCLGKHTHVHGNKNDTLEDYFILSEMQYVSILILFYQP